MNLCLRVFSESLRGAVLTSGRAFAGSSKSSAARIEASGVAAKSAATLGVKNQGDDETIETQDLSENEDQDHADEELS